MNLLTRRFASMTGTTTTVGSRVKPSALALVDRKARFGPADVVYTENAVGAYRGLVFAMVFNVLLFLTAAAAYGLWRLLR